MANEKDDTTGQDEPSPDEQVSSDDPTLTELDKTLADSFPSSDPPSMP